MTGKADLSRTVTLLSLAPIPRDCPEVLLRPVRSIFELGWRRGYAESQPCEWFANLDSFYAWDGRMMERDLTQKLGRPGVWLTSRDLAIIHR